MHSWRDFGNPVGADDPVRPREKSVFYGNPRKIRNFPKADRGVRPYEMVRYAIKIRRQASAPAKGRGAFFSRRN